MVVGDSVHNAAPVAKLGLEVTAPSNPGVLELLECDGVGGEFGSDGSADVLVALLDTDLDGVARVVSNGDTLADVRGEHRTDVAGAAEPDPVALHDPPGSRGEQQHVEVFRVSGGPRDPSVSEPTLDRWLPGLRVRPAVLLRDEKLLKRSIQLREGELRRSDGVTAGAVRDVTGQVRQQLGGDGAEQALNFSAALRDTDAGVDQLNVRVEAH